MQWRRWMGLKPTEQDFAEVLLGLAKKAGLTGWSYQASDSTLRSEGRTVNLTNIFREFSLASHSDQPGLLQKYQAMLTAADQVELPALWTVARTHIFPLLRSRHESALTELSARRSGSAFPKRAAQSFADNVDIVIGYDHGQTVSQVQASKAEEWGIPMDQVIEQARANLRALPKPTWEPAGVGVWKLESDEGYQESFLQLPKAFDTCPARGEIMAMIPNRGVLLATGSDEPDGLTHLLATARQSHEEAPWPLCGDLFRVTPSGTVSFTPEGDPAILLSALQRLDIAGIYDAQKELLEAYHTSIGDDVFVATFQLYQEATDSRVIFSSSTWTAGCRTLLPKTDRITFVKDLDTQPQTLNVRWEDAERIVGHYFQSTQEDPLRFRVDASPSAEEWVQLTAVAV